MSTVSKKRSLRPRKVISRIGIKRESDKGRTAKIRARSGDAEYRKDRRERIQDMVVLIIALLTIAGLIWLAALMSPADNEVFYHLL